MVEGAARELRAIVAADMAGYSRLMEADEAGVLDRQKRHRRELIDPTLASFGGEIVKTTGDGLIVVFTSVQDAVRAALAIQTAMQEREGGTDEARRILYRIGINLGDVVFEDGDVFGDAVNVAARLETLARPGGRLRRRPGASARRRPSRRRLPGPGRAAGQEHQPADPRLAVVPGCLARRRTARRAGTDTRGAVLHGRRWRADRLRPDRQGAADLKAPNWLNHLEYEWRSPSWAPRWRAFARHNELIRFDQRGNGLSDWDVEDISEDAMIGDMALVADAAGLDRFALFGMSQGCAFSIRYAVEHPERVACLVLLGGYCAAGSSAARPRRSGFSHGHHHDPPGLGLAQPRLSPFLHRILHAGRDPRAGRPFRRAAAHHRHARERAPHLADERRGRRHGTAARVTAPDARAALPRRPDVPAEGGPAHGAAIPIPNARFVELEGANHAPLDGTPPSTSSSRRSSPSSASTPP
jgi:pimeloyl-ACP methyl ester carboxylesterase